jgi:1-acyl-sn-glycerol-3-phosphate acyltransferase
MPKNAKMPRLRHVTIRVKFGPPLDFSEYSGKKRDRLVLRSVTDDIMNAIVALSGQARAGEYAASGKPSVSQGAAAGDTDDDLSQELTG